MNEKMLSRLTAMKKRYQQIEVLLTDDAVLKDVQKIAQLSKEKAQLLEIVEVFDRYLACLNNIKEANEWLTSEETELVAIAREDLRHYETMKTALIDELTVLLLPKDPNDDKNVIIEIRGAAGGDEGNIFAGDLMRMYLRYAELQRWKGEILEAVDSPAGGYSSITFLLKGKKVFSKMKFESGAHRVQRVPKTEAKGRVHTSTATVAVLPEVDEVTVVVKASDLKIDTYRASGAGGQHVNTTDSAVRITHLPTGIVVTSQDGRSQHDNKALAMQHLRSKIYEQEQNKQRQAVSDLRKQAVGTGDRSEKIRTYNYPQNRVTDHRINLTINRLDYIMEGNLDEIIAALINDEQQHQLEEMNNED